MSTFERQSAQAVRDAETNRELSAWFNNGFKDAPIDPRGAAAAMTNALASIDLNNMATGVNLGVGDFVTGTGMNVPQAAAIMKQYNAVGDKYPDAADQAAQILLKNQTVGTIPLSSPIPPQPLMSKFSTLSLSDQQFQKTYRNAVDNHHLAQHLGHHRANARYAHDQPYDQRAVLVLPKEGVPYFCEYPTAEPRPHLMTDGRNYFMNVHTAAGLLTTVMNGARDMRDSVERTVFGAKPVPVTYVRTRSEQCRPVETAFLKFGLGSDFSKALGHKYAKYTVVSENPAVLRLKHGKRDIMFTQPGINHVHATYKKAEKGEILSSSCHVRLMPDNQLRRFMNTDSDK